LIKLGVNMASWDYVVALAGNPNTGKSTVFNSLTGLRQHTGNWPGKTVTRAEGGFSYAGKRYKIVDLPGTYSLLSTSTDEEVARNFILFGQPDVTVIVVDATRLERNLNLVLQVLEITSRAVVCLNLVDEAKRHQLEINDRLLAKELGVPVIPTAARQGQGIQELLKNIHAVATGEFVCKPHRIKSESKEVKQALGKLTSMIENQFPGLTNARWVALRLLEGDQRLIDAIKTGELGNLIPVAPSDVMNAKLNILENGKIEPHSNNERTTKSLPVLQ
jgi:ferrous iron transport protein B